MKKQEENQPIDDLFARKLGNASLSPSPDGFERLQARMSEAQPEARVVIWRNPAMQRYMAIAACLLLVCLFGWLYQRSDSEFVTKGEQVANTVNQPQKSVTDQVKNPVNKSTMDKKLSGPPVELGDHLANLDRPVKGIQKLNPSVTSSGPSDKSSKRTISVSENEPPAITQMSKNADKIETAETALPTVKIASSTNPDTGKLADSPVKPAALAERVLTVTIEEPASLVAARQIAKKEANAVAATDEKPEKEAKGNLWEQVRRIKQGEVFARRDNPNNEDKGLLGRAYSGLKQSFEKDKSEK